MQQWLCVRLLGIPEFEKHEPRSNGGKSLDDCEERKPVAEHSKFQNPNFQRGAPAGKSLVVFSAQ